VAQTGNDNLNDIIRGCLQKKEKSQELLYKRYFGYAFKVAMIYNRDRDNALEIVNDSFIKVFKSIGSYDNAVPFKIWLNKIVVNTSIDKFRKNAKNYLADEQETFLIPDNSPGVVTQLTAQDILRLLNQLPEIHRLVFNLYEIEGYSHDEISSLLRIPVNSSRVYLARSKKKLRELFRIFFNTSYEKIGS
jgi:RNA polymerase sigma-70 factor (ECF subfamily)